MVFMKLRSTVWVQHINKDKIAWNQLLVKYKGNRKVSSDSNFSGNALRVFWYIMLPIGLLL